MIFTKEELLILHHILLTTVENNEMKMSETFINIVNKISEELIKD